jgi:hypothetical protein
LIFGKRVREGWHNRGQAGASAGYSINRRQGGRPARNSTNGALAFASIEVAETATGSIPAHTDRQTGDRQQGTR